MIRIGDYKVTVPPGKPECMTASDRGIFFNIPHFYDGKPNINNNKVLNYLISM